MALETELSIYRREHQRLLAEGNEGKYVVIKGTVVAGIYDECEQALAAGYERFGIEPFLAKQILAVEKPLIFTHRIRPCQSSPGA